MTSDTTGLREPMLPANEPSSHGGMRLERRNARLAIGDSVAVGLASAGGPFVAVFLARLGASSFEVSLLTALPALTGLLLAIPVGRFLMSRHNLIPLWSAARGLNQSTVAWIAITAFLAPPDLVVPLLLVVWAVFTLPQLVSMVGFAVVMDGVSGPGGRYELMSRRWSVLGLANVVSTIVVATALDRLPYPMNYQVVFLALGGIGVCSVAFSSRIRLPDNVRRPHASDSRFGRMRAFGREVREQPAFVAIVWRRMVWTLGSRLVLPLVPLFYVRELGATDAEIGIIAAAQTLSLLVGYAVWRRVARVRGGRTVLRIATVGVAFGPLLLSQLSVVWAVAVVAALSAVFQAGIDLAFFDEVMKTVPRHLGTALTGVDQTAQNLVALLVPVLVILLTGSVGIRGGLAAASLLLFVAAALFLRAPSHAAAPSG